MTKKLRSKKKFQASFFKVLMLVVSLFSLVLIVYPFIPQLLFWIRFEINDYDWREQESIRSPIIRNTDDNSDEIVMSGNRIIIPVIGVDVDVVEGGDDSSLNRGAWHRPSTGDPESGGNMVITGHRFQYLPPNNITFYHLDKVEEGDEIIVYWNEIEYHYVVVETFIVEPEDVEIEEDSAFHILTLYTCTPLWTASKRLVVRAEPID